jgi:hypothetical protein
MKNKIFISGFLLLFFTFAQVGINTTSPDASAVLDVSSKQGILGPRISLTSATMQLVRLLMPLDF